MMHYGVEKLNSGFCIKGSLPYYHDPSKIYSIIFPIGHPLTKVILWWIVLAVTVLDITTKII